MTPFFIVFLQEQVGADKDLETYRFEDLPLEKRETIEADSFWCISKFLDSIQDNYIFAQLGIQEKVNQLKELIQRIDGKTRTFFFSCFNNIYISNSDTSQSPSIAWRGLLAILLSLDE